MLIAFLFGIVFGWLIGLTCFQFRRETEQTHKEVWKQKADDYTWEPTEKAEFISNDRVNEIIKGKKDDLVMDDILV